MDNSTVSFAQSAVTITIAMSPISEIGRETGADLATREGEVMLAVRVALSNPGRAAERETYLEDHKRHLRSGRVGIVQSGPIVDEFGEGSGGVVVADVSSLEEMHRFSAEDPFVLHDVYASVAIYEWRPTIGGHR